MIKKLLMMFVATMAAMGAWAEIRFGDTYSWRIEKFLDGWYDSEMLKASGVCIYTGPIADAGTETRMLVEVIGAISKKDINPVIENLGFDGTLTASVWTDKELRDKAMPSSSTSRYWGRESGWIDDRTPGDISNYPGDNCEYNDVGYEYENDDFGYEWPMGLWPNGMTDDGRFWIVVDIKPKKQNCWSGLGEFKVRLSGDDSPSVSLYVTYSPTDIWMNIIGGFDNIFRGIKILNNKSHFLFNIDFYEPWSASYNTPIHNYWADGFVDVNHRVTLELPEAGTLYLSSHWYDLIDDDKISGADSAELVEVDELADSEDARSYFFENGTAFPFGAAYWKVKVNSKRKIYIDVGEDDDFEITRMQFFPEHGKSVAVEASWVSLAPEIRYQLNENDDIGFYLQGYVTGTGVYKVGETVSLKAIPGPGEEFSHWELMYGNFPEGIDTTKTTLNFKVTDACAGNADERKQMVVKAVWKQSFVVSTLVAPESDGMGVVSGGGKTAKPGEQLTLKATPNKGYIFDGWYDAEGNPFPNDREFRLAQLPYTVGDSDVDIYAKFAKLSGNVTVSAKAEAGMVFAGWYTEYQPENDAFVKPYISSDGKDYRTASMSYPVPLYAALFPRFVSADEDMQISLDCNPLPYYDANSPMSLGVLVDSCSLPTVTAANLPTGLKFDAKTLMISGTPTKPGEVKDVKFTVKNLTNKKGETIIVSIKIGDARAASLPDLPYNNSAEDYDPFVPGVAQDMAAVLGSSTMARLAEGGWSVTGLPAGMKFDPRSGKITGAPTDANKSYLVTFKKGSEIATITLNTGAFPKLTIDVEVFDDNLELVQDAAILKQFKVVGAGSYAANKELKLTATAPKGYVFAGWKGRDGYQYYEEDGSDDYRVASNHGFRMPANDYALVATFISVKQDCLSVDAVDEIMCVDQGETFNPELLKRDIRSESFPTVSVKGLPSGVKFDAKTLRFSGTITDKNPKWYDLVVTMKNAGGYTFTFVYGISVNGGWYEDMDELGAQYGIDFSMLNRLHVGVSELDRGELPLPTGLKVQISNLPTGLKLEREEQSWGYEGDWVDEWGADDDWGVMCDSVLGRPSKPGVYMVSFTGKDPKSKKTYKTVKRVVVRDCESVYVDVKASPQIGGTVTGSGLYAGGSNLKLTAKANKGYVFCHWENSVGQKVVSDFELDCRNPSLSEMVNRDTEDEYTAIFSTLEGDGQIDIVAWVPQTYDSELDENLCRPMRDDEVWVRENQWTKLKFTVDSLSLPAVTVTGLPKGLEFRGAKDVDFIYDMNRQFHQVYRIRPVNEDDEDEDVEFTPGEYDIFVSAKNLSGASTTRRFLLKIPHYCDKELSNLGLNYDYAYLLTPGKEVTWADLGINEDALYDCTVTGLPAGMTFKNGVLSGSPTEPDKAYTVWFKRNGRRATVTMRTMPYPKLVLEVDPALENYTDPNVEIPAVNLKDFKLTGAGSYKAGALVKLGATAPEGWVFAGWSGVYEPSYPFLDEKNEDTRQPSYVLKMPEDGVTTLTARFVRKENDVLAPMGNLANMPVRLVKGDRIDHATRAVVRNLFPATGSESFADIKASSLPPGVTFDPQSQLLAGTPTKSGVYYATFAAKNQSGFTFTVLAKFMVTDTYYTDVSDPADVDTIPAEWRIYYGLEYLQTFDWGSIFQVGFIPDSNYGGRYEDYNWGYMIPEDDMDLGCYSKLDGVHDGVVSISGLPKGVTVVEDKHGDYVNMETKECSVPVEAGWTRFTVKVKNPYDQFQSEGTFSRMVPVFDSPSRYVAPKVAGVGGSVSGGGVWNAGKQYTVSAVPSKGYVFSGWYRDRECTMVAENWTLGKACDYRQPKQVWTVESIDNYMPMGSQIPVYLYAKFTPASEVDKPFFDILGYDGGESQPYYSPDYIGSFEDGSLVLNIVNNRENFDNGASDFSFVVNADSLPSVTMQGLPAGAALDASFADGVCVIEFCEGDESELTPGTYPVVMSVKVNGVTYKYDFTIVVGNKRSGFNYALDYSTEAQRYQCNVGASSGFYLVSQSDAYDWYTLSVKNLPAGMVWDPETGMVTGVPSKTGRYTVTIITEDSEYGDKYEDTVTVCVDALPGWVVGKFYGSVITYGYGWEWPTLLTVDISNSGIAKASLSDPEPGVVSRTTEISMRFDDENTLRCDFVLDTDFECSSGTFYIRPHDCHGGVIGVLTGSEEGVDEDDDYYTAEWKAYQHMFDKETDVVLPWFPQNDNTCKLDTSEIGELTLKFGADGKVSAIAGNRNYLMQDSWLSVIDYDEYLETVTARLYIDGYNAKDDCAVGYDLIFTIPCDRNEKASASKIMIEVTDTIIGW